MLAKGLLVEDRDGQEYLLSVNEQGQGGSHDVRISRRVAGRWVLMEVTEPPVSSVREGVIGALLDFFTGICRLLYPKRQLSTASTDAIGRSAARDPIMKRRAFLRLLESI